jgi:hypothetical protein
MFRHTAVIAGYWCNKAQTNHVRRILQRAMTLTRIIMFLLDTPPLADGKGADVVRVRVGVWY